MTFKEYLVEKSNTSIKVSSGQDEKKAKGLLGGLKLKYTQDSNGVFSFKVIADWEDAQEILKQNKIKHTIG